MFTKFRNWQHLLNSFSLPKLWQNTHSQFAVTLSRFSTTIITFALSAHTISRLHVERQRANVGHRTHATHTSHHLALDILETLALRLRHVKDDEEEANDADDTEKDEHTTQIQCDCGMRKDGILNKRNLKMLFEHLRAMPPNVFVTRNVIDQLKPVATDAAFPRIFAGKISPIISQGIGPKPSEKHSTYIIKLANGTQPKAAMSPILFSCR